MKKQEAFESYPLWMVATVMLVSMFSYLVGAYILFSLWAGFGLLFILYVLVLEVHALKEGCVDCYYYGKRCAMGRGKIAPLFFKRGDPKRFCKKEVNFKKLLPQILVLVFPLAGGAVLLYLAFSWLILALMAIPPVIWFFGNPVIYGRIACAHCKQGRKCCPAMEFFSAKRKK